MTIENRRTMAQRRAEPKAIAWMPAIIPVNAESNHGGDDSY
ncbi:hypothetical protein L288_14165 [Sphingobium quisquiliarum P25]|uniref:Uncharacterized protein n=1 Tax=Sphingobium quisquiliarum P25 TaxID=1329909 RepID=T0I3K7_9SPHN|nr:hypothetical protein L288_14165 [Sphingobium quisquiliarum P25]